MDKFDLVTTHPSDMMDVPNVQLLFFYYNYYSLLLDSLQGWDFCMPGVRIADTIQCWNSLPTV